MNISLPHALERFVREQVESGLYESSSEVHREALRLLMAKQGHEMKRDDLRVAIDIGIEQADRGESKACTPNDIIRLSEARRSGVAGQ
tara:strand:- start:28 stop:291 length:264 start_codon:yes stop_codon:yes gene_type:complete